MPAPGLQVTPDGLHAIFQLLALRCLMTHCIWDVEAVEATEVKAPKNHCNLVLQISELHSEYDSVHFNTTGIFEFCF